jgi:Fe-S-cluster containining protein
VSVASRTDPAAADASPAPWYAGGLRFRCTGCGKCCTGAPGHVWVTREEVVRMARALGLSRRAFEERHVRRVGDRLSLRERDNGDCAMLRDGKTCAVYAVKPANCSAYPFWKGVLESEDAWREEAARCEGIGQGDLYTREEIERVASGDPAPLLAKQAAAAARAAATQARGPAGAEPDLAAVDEATWRTAFRELEAIYADLDRALPAYRFTCSASGRCCDFDAYGHRLYATTIEAEYFFRRSAAERANENARHCPAWGANRLCTAREGRMLGCRTYFCGPYPAGTPEEVHAAFHPRIQALHDRLGIPYRYRDVLDWAAERRPARG